MPRRCERRTLPIELIPHDEYVSLDQKDILGGTRTLNLEIRSLTPYPLGHEDGSVTRGRIAQMVERWSNKPSVVGSSPTMTTFWIDIV